MTEPPAPRWSVTYRPAQEATGTAGVLIIRSAHMVGALKIARMLLDDKADGPYVIGGIEEYTGDEPGAELRATALDATLAGRDAE
jgi:hypothetical protein